MTERQITVLGRNFHVPSTESAREAGAAAELAASFKEDKYAKIGHQRLFAPTEVETLGSLNTTVCQMLAI